MTQVEQILLELEKAGDRGLLSAELRENTGIAAGTLRTTLYDLRKRELVRKAGGTRGSFRYAITAKGRAELHSKQPLLKKGYEPTTRSLSDKEEVLEQVLRLTDRTGEFQLLQRFATYLWFESGLSLDECENLDQHTFETQVLRFMGVEPDAISDVYEELDSLVTNLRGMVSHMRR
jgi:DNA-binding MarR family transcriptional regulator